MHKYIDVQDFCNNKCNRNNDSCDKQKCAIWGAHAADVSQVVHGRLIVEPMNGRFHTECSVCGSSSVFERNLEFVVNYCPICGAKMYGGKA